MQELVTWLGYNCGLALLPIGLVSLFLWMTNVSVSLSKLIRDGQLFLYAAVLAAAAIGDLMKLTESQPKVTAAAMPSPMWTLALVVCIILATFLFGVSACAKNINDRRLALMSYAFTAGSTALVASMRWSLQLF
jgi:hypothetical protein